MKYTNEVITSPDNIACDVLEVTGVDFRAAERGRKKTETTVRKAEPGEEIVTRNNGIVESVYVTVGGEAIFINNPDDVYVPGNPDGSRWQFSELEQKGYEIISRVDSETVTVKSAQTFPILPEIITQPTCIKDAWGPGQHQFIFKGATLKLNDNGSVTGIDKNAFDTTWEVLPKGNKLITENQINPPIVDPK